MTSPPPDDADPLDDDPRRSVPQLVDHDSYDRAAFDRARAAHARLDAVIQSGARLTPGFEALARDVFFILFKYTQTIRPVSADAEGRAALNRAILGWVRAAPELERLRAETTLDEGKATFGTVKLLDHALRLLKETDTFAHAALRGEFELAQEEAALDALTEAQAVAAELADRPGADPDAWAAQRAQLASEADAQRRRLKRLRRAQRDRIERMPAAAESAMRATVAAMPEALTEAEAEAQAFGQGMGLDGSSGGGAASLELGERLLNQPKLRMLARMVGAFRQVAQAARRSVFERRPAEVHAIEQGRDLGRLLPSEWSLHAHPVLRKSWMLRFAEGALLQYAIEGRERRGRGPMIVCLDGSGSMQGTKELWSKALALTLLELARRQKRPFRAVVFSSGHQVQTFDLLQRPRHGDLTPPAVPLDALMRFADCFPGGGTDFQAPLSAALDLLERDRDFKRGDVVFITDGQAHLSQAFLTRFNDAKARLDFKVYALLVDAERSSVDRDTVARFADRTTTLSRLTAEGVRDLFEAI